MGSFRERDSNLSRPQRWKASEDPRGKEQWRFDMEAESSRRFPQARVKRVGYHPNRRFHPQGKHHSRFAPAKGAPEREQVTKKRSAVPSREAENKHHPVHRWLGGGNYLHSNQKDLCGSWEAEGSFCPKDKEKLSEIKIRLREI